MHPFGLGSRPQAAPVPNNSQQAPGIENLSTLLGSLSLSDTKPHATQAQAAPAMGGTNISLDQLTKLLAEQHGTGMQIWDCALLKSFLERLIAESLRQIEQNPAAYPETGNRSNPNQNNSAAREA